MRLSISNGTCLWFGLVIASSVSAQDARGARHAAAREREAEQAALKARAVVPADAPKPISDAERMKKTALNELSRHPSKKAIIDIETAIFSGERLQSKERIEETTPFRKPDLDRQLSDLSALRGQVEALAASDATWPRLAEYRTRIDGLERWANAKLAFIGATGVAKAEAVAAKKAELQGEWDKKRVTDEGVLHVVHQQNVGKILFSTQDIAADSQSAFVTQTTADAPLFMRAYLAESPWNVMHRANVDCGAVPELKQFVLRTFYSVNGGTELELEKLDVDEATFSKKTSFAPTRSGSLTAGGSYGDSDEAHAPFVWLSGVVGALKVGDNTVRVEMRVFCYGAEAPLTVAKGALSISATEANLATTVGRGKFKLTPSVHGEAELARFKGKVAHQFSEQYTMLDLRTATDWHVERNALGVILSRSLKAVALVKDKQAPGCTMLSLELVEPFDGKSYVETRLAGVFSRPFVCGAR